KLLMRESFGYTVWDLGLPGAPRRIASADLESRPGYQKVGDGFQTVSKVAAAADGSRILVNWKQDTHGSLLMSPAPTVEGGYDFAGEFAPPKALNGIAVGQAGTRYIAFAFTGSSIIVADVTTF